MTFTTIASALKQIGVSYLGSINISAKLKKNGKKSHQYTYGLYLAPASTSGYNVCPFSTPECRKGCLNTSGLAGVEIMCGRNHIMNARIIKTRLFFEHPEFFMAWLIDDIKAAQRKAVKDGYGFSARLNCTSDIDWQNVKVDGKNIFEIFPDVTFYDYTKNPHKFMNKPENYHLTLSYTGRNWHSCKALLNIGFNVAMVFNVKKEIDLPAMYDSYKVVNGDLTDYRVDDSKGIIVGLKWKRIADRKAEKEVLQSCFVVQPNDMYCKPAIEMIYEDALV
jgi:hypothetical protein